MSLVGKKNYFKFRFYSRNRHGFDPYLFLDTEYLVGTKIFFFFLISILSFPPVDRESLDRASIRFIEYTTR